MAVKKDENSEKVIQRIDELEKYVKTTSNSFNIRLHNMGLGSKPVIGKTLTCSYFLGISI